MATKHAFIPAGTSNGCGKTTVTLGLLGLLQQRGLRVQPCKAGPDYLDTTWHIAIGGVASHNLSNLIFPTPVLNTLSAEQLQQADTAVIEGVMGLYNGCDVNPNYYSSATMTKQLGCPMILLVDGETASTSIAATVMGFQRFDPALSTAGVIVNQISSEAHFQLLKGATERYCQVPVLGYVPRVEDVTLPERHLGLVTARESVVNQQAWRDFASLLGRTLDIDQLLALSELAAIPADEWGEQLVVDAGEELTLALADGEASNFYYPDNLALLARCGVRIVRFSPLRNRQLPAYQMIWLDGGYPELHATGPSANREMLAQLHAVHRHGVTICAECGSLMYLGTTLEVTGGERYAMASIIPEHSRMEAHLTRFDYYGAQAQRQTLLAAPGEWLRGHKFHYPDFSSTTSAVLACREQRDGKTLQQWPGGWRSGSAFASYLHVRFAQRPAMLNHWLRTAKRVQ